MLIGQALGGRPGLGLRRALDAMLFAAAKEQESRVPIRAGDDAELVRVVGDSGEFAMGHRCVLHGTLNDGGGRGGLGAAFRERRSGIWALRF